jgi:hypothetical protein
MPPSMRRRGAVVTAAAIATLGLAGAASGAILPTYQVNNDPANGIDPNLNAGVSDVADGSLTGGQRVPWAAFEQQTHGEQQIFVRSFKNGVFTTRGQSLNIDPDQEAEEPSIDFAGTGRTVPWTTWYEPNVHLPGGETNIFASRFDAPNNKWIPEGQDRAPNFKVPSLNIHTDREAVDPSVAGGAAVPGKDPVPWITWQEKDGAATNADSKDQIFVSRGIKGTTTPVDCSANEPGGGTSVAKFCWQQVGLKRLQSNDPSGDTLDPSLNIDRTRNGVEPDIAFTGANDKVPWVVWYEKDSSGQGLAGNEQVFAAKAVSDTTTGAGGFHWQAVGNGTAGQTNILDNSGSGACDDSIDAEGACSLNLDPKKDAEDPRVAAGTLNPANPTSPWVVWAETTSTGKDAIFVSRLVGDHFELANGGLPLSNPNVNSAKPDITFSRNTPYVSWQKEVAPGEFRTVVGHFTSLTSFVIDTPAEGLAPSVLSDVREPLSSACTSDPFTADGQACPADDDTPVFLRTTASHPQRLLLNLIGPGAHTGGPGAPGGGGNPGEPHHHGHHHRKHWPQISGRSLRLRADGSVRVKLTCPATHGKRCKGTLRLTARHHLLGKQRFSLRARHSARVTVHLKPSAQQLVRSVGRLKVKVSAGTSSKKVLLRA